MVLNDSKILKNVIRKLKAGEVLAILPDVRSKTPALAIDFLGGTANLGAGVALFAQMANCPIVPVLVTRKGWAQHEANVFPPIVPDRTRNKQHECQRML